MAERAEQGNHLEIRKYSNRRYYDATHSRHLTLDEIRKLVQQGYDLRVVNAKTGRDITAQVLTQIILDLDTPKLDSLPVPLLVRLIRVNDQLVKDFIEKYFNQAFKSFLEYQQQLEEQFRRTHGLPTPFAPVTAWTKAIFQPFASVFEPRPQDGQGSPGDAARENSQLRQRISELQKELEGVRKSRGKRRNRSKRKTG